MGAKRWRDDEEAQLQKRVAEGWGSEAIAEELGRPVNAVEARLKLLQREAKAMDELKATVASYPSGAASESAPARSVTPLAALILAAAMEHARYGSIALHCQDLGVSLPKEVAEWFEHYRSEPGSDVADEVDDDDAAPGLTLLVRHGWVAQPVLEGGRQVGWKIDLPPEHSDGLRSVQVRVE